MDTNSLVTSFLTTCLVDLSVRYWVPKYEFWWNKNIEIMAVLIDWFS